MSDLAQLKELIANGSADICDLIESADLFAEEQHPHSELLCELASLMAHTEDFAEQRLYAAMFLDLADIVPNKENGS